MIKQFTRAMKLFRRGTVVLLVASLAYLAGPVFQVSAVTTTDSTRTSDWLAAQVGPDGAVNVPGETFSTTTQTMYVANGLAASGQHRDALERAMGYIALHVDDWVVNDGSGSTVAPVGSDLPERLGELILLVRTVGGDPTSFGSPATNLLTRVQALYGVSVFGFYGYQEPYSAVQDQSFVVMALLASGITPPSAAVQWIAGQQCIGGTNPTGALGGWQAFRANTGNALNDCDAPDSLNYVGADTNSTAFAVQALKAAGQTAAIPSALTFLHAAQTTSGPQAAGFPWFTGGDPDPNSTALVIQALLASGQSPTGGAWAVNGSSPFAILSSWQITTPGADFGSIYASWQPGIPSLLATYQGLWGLTLTAFPFPVLPAVPAPDAPPVVPTFTG
ncbi:MAG: hypothetical protein NT081_05730 [Actinobacteria bacterium]|nr:hypothetical protein [Actinomycetota bacterium]